MSFVKAVPIITVTLIPKIAVSHEKKVIVVK
jgi:hypothetical protein